MQETFQASCLCGGISLAYCGPIGPAKYCHCEGCRRANGSAFDITVRVEKKKLEIIARSELRSYKYVGGSGKEIERAFCGSCGSPVFTLYPATPDYAWVKAGLINNPELVKPAFENWASDKVSWATITISDTDHFRRSPRQEGLSPETCENLVPVR
jgi:hypothetical protein